MVIIDDSELNIKAYSPTCFFCRHLKDDVKRSCTAFDEIPLPIWNGDNNHRSAYTGDKGIQFEPKA